MSSTMTVRLENSVKERLEKLAEATHRTKSFLASQAIENYIRLNEWQINEIQQGLKEADAGDFASNEEVMAVFKKYED